MKNYDEVCDLLRNGLLRIGWLCKKANRSDIPYAHIYSKFAILTAEQMMECLMELKEGDDMDIRKTKYIKLCILRDHYKEKWEKLHKECKELKKQLEKEK